MKERAFIQGAINKAWKATIEQDYASQRVNSERSLQASFWSHINPLLPPTRRLFIEPTLIVRGDGGTQRIIPDIVICNTREVIAVIELKYLPRTAPKYEKDIRSLSTIAQNRKGITLSNSRFRGEPKDATRYKLSDKILFVWAGVHGDRSWEPGKVFADRRTFPKGSYLQLHAVTRKGAEAEIYREK